MTFTLPLWVVIICATLIAVGFICTVFFLLLALASNQSKLKPNEIPAHWM